MLDKLFSREIERRTGAHAINIYIEQNATAKRRRRRARSIGSQAMEASSGQTKITTKQSKRSFFYRLNVRLPWLKLVAVLVVGIIAILDLLNLTISQVGEPADKIKMAPMSHHVRITERTLEGKMLVALTFDDGPSPATTPALLDILTEKGVPATFFVLGRMMRNYPDIVQRAERERHEVASHTMYHQNLIRIPVSAVQTDIDEVNSAFDEILGRRPAYVRPPYGNINDAVRVSVGMPIILWSVDTLDWQSKDPSAIVATVMSQVHDGAIILMHDIYPTSVEAIPTLVDTLRQAGYEFVTISELVKARKVALSSGTAYYNFRP